MLSDEAGTYLYAASGTGGSLEAASPNLTDEILSFPGFKKRRKRKRGEASYFEEAIVPVLRPPAMTRTGKASIAAADHACLGGMSIVSTLPATYLVAA